MRRVWPWAICAVGVLAVAQAATLATGSTLVALGGVFVAAQLVVPVLVDHRRLAAARLTPAARPITTEGRTGRRGAGAVGWVRLDARRPGAYRLLNAGRAWSRAEGLVATMGAAPSARHTP
jgi:hypothetical protein